MDNEVWESLMKEGAEAFANQSLKQAEEAFAKAVQLAEQTKSTEQALIESLTNLAVVQQTLRHYTEAETTYKRALELLDGSDAPQKPELPYLLRKLGTLYFGLSEFDEAEPLYKRAAELVEQELGSEDVELAKYLTNLASVYHEKEETEKAEKLYQRILKIKTDALGPRYDGFELDIENLAGIYFNSNQMDKAESLYLELLAAHEQMYGDDALELIPDLKNLIEIKSAQAKIDQSDQFYDRIVSLQESMFGPDNPASKTMRQQQAAGYFMRAVNHERNGNNELAQADFARATNLGLDQSKMQIIGFAGQNAAGDVQFHLNRENKADDN